jgi:hypothetical protein
MQLAIDFFTVPTARLRVLFMLVVLAQRPMDCIALSRQSQMRRTIVWIGCALVSACSLQRAALTQDAGTPGPPLDYAKCQAAWKIASPHGDALSKEKAAPYVVNVTVLDVNLDGKISEHEFKDGCQGGWIKDPSTVASPKGVK